MESPYFLILHFFLAKARLKRQNCGDSGQLFFRDDKGAHRERGGLSLNRRNSGKKQLKNRETLVKLDQIPMAGAEAGGKTPCLRRL
jgi:hypothetical protein